MTTSSAKKGTSTKNVSQFFSTADNLKWRKLLPEITHFSFFISSTERGGKYFKRRITSNDLRLETESDTAHNKISQIAIANIQDIDDEQILAFHDTNKAREVCKWILNFGVNQLKSFFISFCSPLIFTVHQTNPANKRRFHSCNRSNRSVSHWFHIQFTAAWALICM